MKVVMLKDSIANSIRISTLILEYPRFIHSEFMTHRVFSRNSASSRAIPTEAIIKNIFDNPAEIVWWGKAQSGMQAKEELSGIQLWMAKKLWSIARMLVVSIAYLFSYIGLHKQLANRILETFQNIRVVVTSTEWNNFMALRNHPDAQPEIQQLAKLMQLAFDNSTPTQLEPGEWHIPYIHSFETPEGTHYYANPSEPLTLDQALKVSASMAAQESYRKSDNSLVKAESIFARLVDSFPVHASPTEHQAQAMHVPSTYYVNDNGVEPNEAVLLVLKTDGITHVNRDGTYWSGNFRGWVQHRQLIPGHDIKG